MLIRTTVIKILGRSNQALHEHEKISVLYPHESQRINVTFTLLETVLYALLSIDLLQGYARAVNLA